MAVGDFNGDKQIDFVGVNPGASGISGVGFFAGDGKGGFTEQFYPLQTLLNSPNSIDAADFNGNGKLDIALAAPDVTVIAFGNGDGTFQLAENQLVLGWGPSLPPTFTGYDFQIVRAADMDGDGKPDVVAIDNYTGQMAVVLNDGEGGLGEAQTFTVAQGLDDLRVADLNGDGLPDVVVVNPTTQTISVFLSIKPLISSPIAVSVGANQQLVGSNVSITTKVASSGSVAPTGSITLLDGSAVLGKQTLDNTGLATFTMDTLAAGMHSLTTNYSGETMYASATSQAISVAITDFQVALSQPAEAVKAGATAAFTLALTPIAGLTGTVNISCSGLPSGTVCSTVSMDLNGQKTTTTVTVTTTAASSSVRHVRPDDRSLHYAGIFLGGLQG